MRTFSAVAEKCDKFERRARIGIARASATRAAARGLIARLAQCFPKQFHGVCLAGISATFAMVAVGAHADSIKIGGTGTGLGAMKLMAQEFNKSRPDAQLIVTPSLGSTGAIRAVLAGTGNLALHE